MSGPDGGEGEVLHVMMGPPACSNRCAFCIDRSRGAPRPVGLAEVQAELERVRGRTRSVTFTAGEPTLNPALAEAAWAAREKGFTTVGLVTNGRRLQDEAFCRRLLEAGINDVVVSLHGPTARAHDGATGRPGSFAQAVRGLLHLSRLKASAALRLSVSCVVTKLNLGLMRPMKEYCERFSLDRLNFNVVEPRGRAADDFERVVPRYADVLRAAHDSGLELRAGAVSLSRVPACAGGFEWAQERFLIASASSVAQYRAQEGKVQGPPCRRCLAAPRCPGIWALYAERYGWEEFVPAGEPRELAGRTLRVTPGEPVSAALRRGYLRGYRRARLELDAGALDEPRWAGWLREARDVGFGWVGLSVSAPAGASGAALRALARAAALVGREGAASWVGLSRARAP